MMSALAGGHAMKPTRHMAEERPRMDLEVAFPKAFGDWQVDTSIPVQLIAPDLQAFLDKIYNQTLSRTYINRTTGDRIMLSVAYGGDQTDATRAHRPEVCYPAQGFEILSNTTSAVNVRGHELPVRQLVARQGPRVEPISYWIIVGDLITLSGTEQKLAQLRYAAQGLIAEGMLVRVSNIGPDAQKGYALHQDFIRQMAQGLGADVAPRIVGPVAAPQG
jgi:EpsI family protein